MEAKKKLLNHWMNLHQETPIIFPQRNQQLEITDILISIEKLLKGENYSDSIYVLRILSSDGPIPVYVGRSNSPISRWKTHLGGVLKGKGLYQRWRKMLLDDNNCLLQNIDLLIIIDTKLSVSPIPSFPCTIGAVEYQLVSLISDVYPDSLLNHEGNRRK